MESNFQEIQNKLDDYRLNLEKIQMAIKKNSEKTQDEQVKNQRNKDLQQLIQDIEKAIAYHQDLLKLSKSQVETYFSSLKLKPSDIGKKCNLYYEKDKNWYPGEITSVNIQEQTAEVIFFGFSERFQLPASFIQILIPPKLSDLREGLEIEALLEDGKWHYGVVETIEEGAITVRITRWGHKHSLALDAIRLVGEEKKQLLDKDTFIIPNKFKILPNDPENVRMKKKKKS